MAAIFNCCLVEKNLFAETLHEKKYNKKRTKKSGGKAVNTKPVFLNFF